MRAKHIFYVPFLCLILLLIPSIPTFALSGGQGKGTFIVKVTVNNTFGGNALASNFTLDVDAIFTNGSNVIAFKNVSIPGNALGTQFVNKTYNVTYNVTEVSLPNGYIETSEVGCSNVTIIVSVSVANCTITDNDTPAHLTIIKIVNNTNGGAETANQFTMHVVDNSSASNFTFARLQNRLSDLKNPLFLPPRSNAPFTVTLKVVPASSPKKLLPLNQTVTFTAKIVGGISGHSYTFNWFNITSGLNIPIISGKNNYTITSGPKSSIFTLITHNNQSPVANFSYKVSAADVSNLSLVSSNNSTIWVDWPLAPPKPPKQTISQDQNAVITDNGAPAEQSPPYIYQWLAAFATNTPTAAKADALCITANSIRYPAQNTSNSPAANVPAPCVFPAGLSTKIGTYTFEIKVTAANGKSEKSSSTANVIVDAELTTKLLPAKATIAVGQSVTFNYTTQGGTGDNKYSYGISPNHGFVRHGYTLNFTEAGTYTINLKVTDESGEVATASSVITVNPKTTTTTTTSTSTSTTSKSTTSSTTSESTTSTSVSTTASTTSTTTSLSTSSTIPSTTSTTTSSSTTIIPNLKITLFASKTEITVGQSVNFTNVTTGGIGPYTYQYQISGGVYITNNNMTTFLTPGTYNVNETVTDGINEKNISNNLKITVDLLSTTTTSVTTTSTTTSLSTSSTSSSTTSTTTSSSTTTILPKLTVTALPDSPVIINTTETVNVSAYASGGTGIYSYNWTVSNGTSCPGFTNPGNTANFSYSPNGNTTNCMFNINVTDTLSNAIANTSNITVLAQQVIEFSGSSAGVTLTLKQGFYNVTESPAFGYTELSALNCSGYIMIGENITCTITNHDLPAHLFVVTHVKGGNLNASNFTMIINGANPSPSIFNGSDEGVLVTLGAGAYNVLENSPFIANYIVNDSYGCSGNIGIGQNATCIVTDTYKG